ncbi:MAG: histone deacetylase [Acidimicrobiales bacterium]
MSRVWYAAYGSNVDRTRFRRYLEGGRAAGSRAAERGARDPRPPTVDEPLVLPHAVRFVGRSRRWEGSPAFLEHRRSTRGAWGRRYLVTAEQLADVVAQESRRDHAALPIDDLVEGQVLELGPGRYDGLLLLGRISGVPVVTFTSSRPPELLRATAPSADYLRTIVRGLVASHGRSPGEVAAHLVGVAGVSPTWSAAAIAALAE